MLASCPVCDAPVEDGEDHCAKCGFPVLLRKRLSGSVPDPLEPEPELPAAPAPPAARASAMEGPEAETNASLARALEERMELLRTIDRDAPDVTPEMCEAALNEAAGRLADAQQVLRSAQGRLDSETEELLTRHLENLESRGRALEATGLRLALDDELGHLAESMVGSPAEASVAALAAAERRMDGLETHWRSLQGLIAQVATLRQRAAELGIALDQVPDRLSSVRASLASMPVTEQELDIAAQVASETLMRLHDTIPPALEVELARHAETLDRHLGRRTKTRAARLRHAEAIQHLRSGRLEEAARSVRELRAELDELAQEVEELPPTEAPAFAPTDAPASPPAPAALEAPPGPGLSAQPEKEAKPPAAEGLMPPTATPALPSAPSDARPAPDAATVATLMKKARSVAARIRSLPANSEQATAAAREVHEATALLRAGKYEEADAALSRIMRALVGTGPGS